ncbi:MAG: hypothetical protein TEF_05100 [Rhizobiales bacterium NRL2]|jgi:crotonobetainyl-CoA:carnitine CoA-transferase CaiB-like acyl-CoA transferase|nr:MAG: hypothetical protein TEF_05100 [Rhizobiales bacterium NRL2]
MGILDGLKVIDAASFIAGPSAATLLGDFGADVIKVEPPGGDGYRRLLGLPGFPTADVDYHWQLDNRNKLGLALDLRDETDRQVFLDLAAQADVLVVNHPLPVRRKLGIAWGDLRGLNPGLIYASLTGFGETGPEADSPGFDLSTYWARSGLMDQVRPDMDGPPAPSVAGQGDHPTGVALFGAIMLALYERRETGRGREVQSSLIANGLWSNACLAQAALAGGDIPRRRPRHAPFSALVNTYRARDGKWFIVSALEPERDWQRLLRVIEHPGLADDPRFSAIEGRRENAAALTTLLDDIFLERDWPDWRVRFEAERLSVGPVYSPQDAVADAQARPSAAVRRTADGALMAEVIDSPLWLEGEAKRSVGRAPATDEHGKLIRSALKDGRSPWRP